MIIGILAIYWLYRDIKNHYSILNSLSKIPKIKKEDYRMFPEIETKELTLEQAISKIEIIKQKDDFEGTTLIDFNNVTQENYKYLPMYFEKIGYFCQNYHIGISFSIFQGNIYLDIDSNHQEVGLAKGDRLILLFDNGEKIDFKFAFARSGGYMKSNTYRISESELKIFIEQKLDKWKLISSRTNTYIVGDNSIFFELCGINKKLIAQEILKYLAKTISFYHLNENTSYSRD